MVVRQAPRSCGACTACCDGWLSGEAHGQTFYPARPCVYRGRGGCTIYEDRPEHPCRSFLCAWIESFDFPAWMKPSEANVIVKRDFQDGIAFLDVIEMGQRLDSRVLSWLVMYALQNKINLRYEVDRGKNKIGSPDFIACPNI